MLQLPGGVCESGGRRRDAAFRPITGELELQLTDHDGATIPARVTAALVSALEQLGGAPPTHERVEALCVDDRRYLMHQLAGAMGIRAVWLTATCDACSVPFDVRLDPAALPVKPAGEGFPYAFLPTADGDLLAHVPTGADQAAVADLDEEEAIAALLERCVEGPLPAAADLGRLEAAIEAVSPEVARIAETACPQCGVLTAVELDSYVALRIDSDALLDDVDALARAYGWTEPDVLRLPRDRRRRYLARITGVGRA